MLGADGPGKAEAEPEAVARCELFCDEWEQASHGGELTGAVEAGLVTREQVTELGEVLTGSHGGAPPRRGSRCSTPRAWRSRTSRSASRCSRRTVPGACVRTPSGSSRSPTPRELMRKLILTPRRPVHRRARRRRLRQRRGRLERLVARPGGRASSTARSRSSRRATRRRRWTRSSRSSRAAGSAGDRLKELIEKGASASRTRRSASRTTSSRGSATRRRSSSSA